MIETLPGHGKRLLAGKAAFDDVLVCLTIHHRGLAGAALVKQHDVPIASYLLEGALISGIEIRRCLSRAAGDWHKRVRLRFQAECRHDRNKKRKDG